MRSRPPRRRSRRTAVRSSSASSRSVTAAWGRPDTSRTAKGTWSASTSRRRSDHGPPRLERPDPAAGPMHDLGRPSGSLLLLRPSGPGPKGAATAVGSISPHPNHLIARLSRARRMYYLDHRRDVVRIPPARLGPELAGVISELAQQQFEGKLVDGQSLAVTIRDVKPIGEGHIIHGDGGVYQQVEYEALLFRPEIQEV